MNQDIINTEKKWQTRWEQEGTFKADVTQLDDKYYILVMFPYPSGDRLHMGHWYQYGLMDTWIRFIKLQGKSVFAPMGFDAFGLPAENFAIKKGVHPDTSTRQNVDYMMKQFKGMGVSYNWDYIVNTSSPEYYKWTQWLFLQLYNKGLAYKQEAPVNWCPSCQTVLANEQVINGLCERCDTAATRRNLNQWFFKITDYAEKLLKGIDTLDWPERTKSMQQHWIGKSTGTEINFKIHEHDQEFTVFTTRPDTLYGVTYVTIAPEHPLTLELTTDAQKAEVEEYIEQTRRLSELDRLAADKEKTGVFTGSYAINPVNNEKVPIWVGDYVLVTYGTGVVMAVPGHDERDFAFATKYNLPIKKVILEEGTEVQSELNEAFTGVGKVINSDKYNDMQSDKMIPAITEDLTQSRQGKASINYRLRDWLVSRQRYWGSPIPIIYCDDCGEVPVPEKDLPVRLPEDVEFKPTGESPLKSCQSFMQAECPKCGKMGQREADTLDTFVCSSWYYLRFPDSQNTEKPFESDLINKVLPVDKYVGGPEHACMHLIYARFIAMAMQDMGYTNFSEPFPSLTHQGLVLGSDGQKMSKSKGNSVSPDPYVEKYGSDVLRLYLAFGFNYTEGGPWDDGGFKAVVRLYEKTVRLYEEMTPALKEVKGLDLSEDSEFTSAEKQLLFVYNNSVKMMTMDTERFMFNTSIARIMELYNALTAYLKDVPKEEQNQALLQTILFNQIILLSPYAPHLAEELWEKAGNTESVFLQRWPAHYDKYLVLDTMTLAVMINGKRRDEIEVSNQASVEEIKKEALSVDKLQKYFEGKKIVKEIYVPKKLLNLIVK